LEDRSKIKSINISPAPHIREGNSLSKMMWFTAAALMLPSAAGVFFFGWRALLLVLSCVAAALASEAVCLYLRRLPVRLGDGSAVVTGILMALILPPSFPIWAAVLGTVFAIAVVKHVFAGLGKNIFNPALMGRAFLTAAFPILITTYSIPYRALDFYGSGGMGRLNSVTSATPLNQIKFEGRSFSGSGNLLRFFLGAKKGSTGETSGLLILLGFIFLLYKKVIDWRLSASYFAGVVLFSAAAWLIRPGLCPTPLAALLLGGVMLGGVFMVTDPVTTPVAPGGKFIFGFGAGLLTVIIRTWSGYPEGVMFSIILMNSITPLINRYTMPRIYGT